MFAVAPFSVFLRSSSLNSGERKERKRANSHHERLYQREKEAFEFQKDQMKKEIALSKQEASLYCEESTQEVRSEV